MLNGRIRWEPVGLIALIALFIIGEYRCELTAQQYEPMNQPSSMARSKPGAGAFFTLLNQIGYRAERLTSSWRGLDHSSTTLVVLEPLSRSPAADELQPLNRWVRSGGSLLYVCSKDPRPADPRDPVAGDIALVKANADLSHIVSVNADSPYTRDVSSLAVSCKLRIAVPPGAGYDVLFRDAQGVVAVHRKLGRGHVFVVTDDLLASNSGISNDDNSVFLVNMVGRPGAGAVAFDEYHHGVGFEADHLAEAGLISKLPAPMKVVLADMFVLGLLLLYNGNCRKAAIFPPPVTEQRLPGDYIKSMARLYQKSGATNLAIQSVYSSFLKELRRHLNAPPDSPPALLAERLEAENQLNRHELLRIMERCEQAIAGLALSDHELVALMTQIDRFRRELGFVGTTRNK